MSWYSIVRRGGGAGINATGGTVTVSGGYRYHTFTNGGTFTVTRGGLIDCLIVAGGGGGAGARSNAPSPGGGGAGGVITLTQQAIGIGSYPIVVGGGGAGGPGSTNTSYVCWGENGEDTTFNGYTAIGGGGGAGPCGTYSSLPPGQDGGSGGGVSAVWVNGSGNTRMAITSGTPGQGNSGGTKPVSGINMFRAAGGGGGAGTAGKFGTSESYSNTANVDYVSGGDGIEWPAGSGNYYAGGGGSGGHAGHYNTPNARGLGGLGGGGNGGVGSVNDSTANGEDGAANTGGGGGGGAAMDGNQTYTVGSGGDGGSGIVIVRYPI